MDMKPILFENTFNHEHVVCDDIKKIQVVDGVEYLTVHRPQQLRTFLMRRDALKQVKEKLRD
jgi:hypothetical protein